MYKYLLFDLDGTITKSEEGIFNCMKYAMDWAGIPYPAPEVFRSFIGPSLYDSFANTLHMDDAQAKEMVAKYRERYNPDGTGSDKKFIITQVLESLKKDHGLTEEMVMSGQAAMIGDRRYDIEGGKACGLQTIGVLYGYGSREEFEIAGADHIVEKPQEILNL